MIPENIKESKTDKVYPIYFSSEKYKQLLVVQSEPEQKWIFKDKEISPEDLIKVLDSIPENIKELEEKYGFELILKEMWVWDNRILDARIQFVILKRRYGYPYITERNAHKNASETDSRIKEQPEPKVGDVGYFWDDEKSYVWDILYEIKDSYEEYPYSSNNNNSYRNFSKTKQPWMK